MTLQDGLGGLVMQRLGVHERAVEIEQQRLRRARRGAGHGLAAAILGLLAACVSPPGALPDEAAQLPPGWELHLPTRYAHWRSALASDLRAVRDALRERARGRWEAAAPEGPLRVLVPEDGARARTAYAELGLEGDPRVPRTFLAERLAVVPLARDDALVAALDAPPRTWRESFRHEAAHLESLRYPALTGAPRWFDEGLAELVAVGGPDHAPASAGTWPHGAGDLRAWLTAAPASTLDGALDAAERAPSEVRYRLWAAAADRVLAEEDAAPWDLARHLAVPAAWRHEAGDPVPSLRGRDADWDVAQGRYLLIAPPLQQVDLELPCDRPAAPASGLPRAVELQLGRTGSPEAGLLLHDGAPERARVRVRFGLGGGLAAWSERGAEVRAHSLDRTASTATMGAARTLRLEVADGVLILRSGDWSRRIPLADAGLGTPLRLRAYVRDGVLRLQIRE